MDASPDVDSDEDGISDYDEVWGYVIYSISDLDYRTVTTDPTNPDSDGDGMSDGWERDNSLDPTDPSDAWSDEDGDGDGLLAVEECQLGTDPWNEDTDGDELPDGWERDHGLNVSV